MLRIRPSLLVMLSVLLLAPPVSGEEPPQPNPERISYWLSVGAKPSETVASMIEKIGIAIPTPTKRPRKKSKAKAKPFVPPKKKVRKPKVKAAPEGEAEGGAS